MPLRVFALKKTSITRCLLASALAAFFALALAFATAMAGGATGQVVGSVVDGTTGQAVPGLQVNLFSFDSSGQWSGTYTTTTDSGGDFVFDKVEIDPGAKYVAASKYKGVAYYSNTGTFSDTKRLSLPFEIFETTSDPGVVAVTDAIWSVNFGKHEMVVGEVYFVSATGNRTYVGEGGKGVLFRLPEGARDVHFKEGEIGKRFVRVSDTAYADVLPLIPTDPHRVSLRYTLTYTGTKASVAHAVPYPVRSLGIFVEDIGEDAWIDIPATEQRRNVKGTEYLTFTSSNIPAGKEIRLELRKLPGNPLKPLPWWAYAGMLAFGSALGVGAAFATRRRRVVT